MARSKQQTHRPIPLNTASLLDVIFLLIIFFLVASQFTSAQLPDLQLPRPHRPVTRPVGEDRLVVNVLPASERGSTAGRWIVAGVEMPAGHRRQLDALLRREVARHGGDARIVKVDLRAAASLAYDQVAPVLDAITQLGIAHVNMVADRED